MTNLLQYFTEGNDLKFLDDYINFLDLGIERKFGVSTNGWTNIVNVANRFLENTDKGGINIVIFDADEDIEKRRADLLTLKDTHGIEFELFLFPNNNNIGCFENLLLEIINPHYSKLLKCFDYYCNCILEFHFNTPMPPIKAKLFAFLEATKQDPKKTNFLNTEYWNLDHL